MSESDLTRPTLTVFCGLPGAGKTTLARQLEAAGRGVRICTDDWQAALGVPTQDEAFHDRLQTALYAHALTLLRAGVDVILEDGLWTRPESTQKFEDARRCGARTELHVFDVTLPELWSRLQRRNAEAREGAYPITYDQLQHAWAVFEAPTDDELRQVDQVTFYRGTSA